MNNEDRAKAVSDFLKWLEDYTYYEVGEDVQSDYGDGESMFHNVSKSSLIEQYRDYLYGGY